MWLFTTANSYHHASQVQHAKRTLALPELPTYQTELVRAVTTETRDLDRHVSNLLAPYGGAFDPAAAPPETACALLVDHLAMRRNKRCLLAYHRVRTQRLDELCWRGVESGVLEGVGNGGGVGASGGNVGGGISYNDSVRGSGDGSRDIAADSGGGGGSGDGSGNNVAGGGATGLSPEEEEYVRQYGDLLAMYKGKWTDVDLTGSLEPPRDLFIDVRVLKDAGEIQTEYGCVLNTFLRLHVVEKKRDG